MRVEGRLHRLVGGVRASTRTGRTQPNHSEAEKTRSEHRRAAVLKLRKRPEPVRPTGWLTMGVSFTPNRMPAVTSERAVLPRAVASGSHHSHGPSRESYTPICKSTVCSETAHAAAAHPAMPAERMRPAFPARTRTNAIAVRSVGKRHGGGRAGRHGRVIGRRPPENKNATGRAGDIASASKTASKPRQHKPVLERGHH